MRIAGLIACVVACSAPAHPTMSTHASLLLVHCGGATDTIAIGGDEIVAVGDEAKRFTADRRIDLGGRLVIPGIHDAHVHEPSLFDAYELPESEFDYGLGGLAEATKNVPDGTWIHATLEPALLDALASVFSMVELLDANGHMIRVSPSVPIDRKRLDQAAPKHPVWVDNATGHVVILNSAAEKLLALGTLPPGSFTGPPGWYYEYGRYAAMRKRGAAATDAQVTAAVDAFEREALAFGITSVTAFPLDIEAERLARVLRATHRRLRWHVVRSPIGGVITPVPEAAQLPDARVVLEGTKYFIDGMQVERGAALTAPYAGTQKDDPLVMGRLDWSPEDIKKMLEAARATGDTLHLHVVGDRALDVVFSAMEALGGDWSKLVVIEHGHLLTNIARAKKLGVTFVQNPFHSEMADINRARLGERTKQWQPLHSMLAAGIPMKLGSDGPLDPFRNIQLAEQHPTNPAEAITREQALAAYTTRDPIWARRATGVAAGAIADLAVLTGDVDDPATRSVLTIVGGEVVYDNLSPASAPSSARTE
jgi:predicted amidohydrolase YtcJ